MYIKRVMPEVVGGGEAVAESSAGKTGPTAVGEPVSKEYKVVAGGGAAVGADGKADVALVPAVDAALLLQSL